MKSITQFVIGSLALLGTGAAAFKAYQIKKQQEQARKENVIEINVEHESRE